MSIYLLSELRERFKNDGLSMYYRGTFDDVFTQKLIDISHASINNLNGKMAKRRMAFLMAESFQNIIRHGIDNIKENGISTGVFGVRNIYPFLHIFSSNLVEDKDADKLKVQLNRIHSLTEDELKDYYLSLLNEGNISEKGGGGLGLIEMAKRSGMPLQYAFTSSPEGVLFGLQIDQALEKDMEDYRGPVLPIDDNVDLYKLLHDEQVILFQKGDFSRESVLPVLIILEENMRRPENYVRGKRLFHISVELLQNITRHGVEVNGRKEAIFTLSMDDEGFRFSTGNYMTPNAAKVLKSKLDIVNVLEGEELAKVYRKTLKESVLNDNDNAGVGLLDIRKFSGKPIEYKIMEDEKGIFGMISVSF